MSCDNHCVTSFGSEHAVPLDYEAFSDLLDVTTGDAGMTSDDVKLTERRARDAGCCSITFLSEFFHMFNLVFLLGGVAVLGVAGWTVAARHHYVPLLSSLTYALTAYLLLLAGILVVVAALLGCCAVWRENRCLLLGYLFMLLLIFVLEAMVGVVAYIYRDSIQRELAQHLNTTFLQSYGVDPAKTDAIDAMQREYKCCGALSYQEWEKSEWRKMQKTTEPAVPDSCCKTEFGARGQPCGASTSPSNIPYTGCYHRLLNELRRQLEVLGSVGLGLSVIQVFGLVLSCALYLKLRLVAD